MLARMWRNVSSDVLLVGVQSSPVTKEISKEVPQKTKSRTIL